MGRCGSEDEYRRPPSGRRHRSSNRCGMCLVDVASRRSCWRSCIEDTTRVSATMAYPGNLRLFALLDFPCSGFGEMGSRGTVEAPCLIRLRRSSPLVHLVLPQVTRRPGTRIPVSRVPSQRELPVPLSIQWDCCLKVVLLLLHSAFGTEQQESLTAAKSLNESNLGPRQFLPRMQVPMLKGRKVPTRLVALS